MRIIGEIPHPNLKITLFKNENKYSVKFENSDFEQTFKMRGALDIAGLEDMQRLIDKTFIAEIEKLFAEQMNIQQRAIRRYLPSPESELPEII